MTKKISIVFLIFVLITNCTLQKPAPYSQIKGNTQGTTYNIIYENHRNENFTQEITRLLSTFDLSLSSYIDSSFISQVNKPINEIELTDSLFLQVFTISKQIWQETDGFFDPTVAPIVEAWGFWKKEKTQTVDSALVDSLMQFVGFEKLSVANNRLRKNRKETRFDVNAIAQGLSVDVLYQFFEDKKLSNFMVEIGGEVRAKGVNHNRKPWRIGIDKPIENQLPFYRELQEIVELKNKALATSGNYRKYTEQDGIRYAHTIDPKTGWPIMQRLLSATILTDRCVYADAYATACMVMGLDKSIELIESLDNVEAYFIYSTETGEFKTYYTKGFENFIAAK